MTRRECLSILQLDEHAKLDDIKRSYRRLAFALHPDLNPGNPDAARDFQRLNEAYVQLCDIQRNAAGTGTAPSGTAAEKEATEKARAQAGKAYEKARSRFDDARKAKARSTPPGEGTRGAREKERDEVLRDLLRDPFARRVFEDIYSQIRHDASQVRRAGKAVAARTGEAGSGALNAWRNVRGSVKDWFQRRIDDEQTVRLPHAQLAPGVRLRLQIRHGFSDKPQTIEITLPPEFQPGRAIRLKGLGKRIGSWKGDLYLKIVPL